MMKENNKNSNLVSAKTIVVGDIDLVEILKRVEELEKKVAELEGNQEQPKKSDLQFATVKF
ncbi:MAG TPA: hypothetical protein VEF53_18825 [Patescibacteria group bacterium]|nr:hypothetical protein [Patescibacteria group bacterium]